MPAVCPIKLTSNSSVWWNGQFVAYRNHIQNYVHLLAQPDADLSGYTHELVAMCEHALRRSTVE